MGFFDRLKSQRDIVKEEIREVPWISLEREEQVKEIIEVSQATPVLIFKHSTTCGISRMVLKQFERAYDIDKKELEPYFLDLRKNRAMSGLVSSEFGVAHESPQILMIKDGKCVYDTSHGSISIEVVKEHL